MAVAAGKIARLIGNHHFLFSHRAHVDGLIRAGTRRENRGARIQQGFEQTFLKRRPVDSATGGHHLKTNTGSDPLSAKVRGKHSKVVQTASGAATNFCDLNGHSGNFTDWLHVADGGRTRDLRLKSADVDVDDPFVPHIGIVRQSSQGFRTTTLIVRTPPSFHPD